MRKIASVADYIESHPEWLEALTLLRDIIISTEVSETVKWGAPTYTCQNKNIVGMAAFKSYVGIWFHQGVFLKDDQKVLINANEENTKGLRQWRFNSVDEIERSVGLIREYVLEAIENQKNGLRIKIDRSKPLIIPDILQSAFDENQDLLKAFESFSLSKKREFTDHIDEAKREETKQNRLNKIIPYIMGGIGLHDKYRRK